MGIMRTELYKLCSRRLVNTGYLILAAFLVLYFGMAIVGETSSCVDGVRYRGLDAVRINREITRPYAGRFTMQQAQQIIDQYGFAGYTPEDYREGNFLNRFITDEMTDFMQTGVRPDRFSEENRLYQQLEEGSVEFAYIEGWLSLREFMMVLNIALCILMSVTVVNVFAEEYMLHTAGVQLTTVHGKRKGIVCKIAAALSYTTVVYLLFACVSYGAFLEVFGIDGLRASASLIIQYSYFGWSIGQYAAALFLMGLVSALINTCIVLFFSAICRSTLPAVILSIVLYLLPLAYSEVLYFFLPVRLLRYILTVLISALPFYIPYVGEMGWEAQSWSWIRILLMTVIPVLCLYGAYHKYRNYQVS